MTNKNLREVMKDAYEFLEKFENVRSRQTEDWDTIFRNAEDIIRKYQGDNFSGVLSARVIYAVYDAIADMNIAEGVFGDISELHAYCPACHERIKG